MNKPLRSYLVIFGNEFHSLTGHHRSITHYEEFVRRTRPDLVIRRFGLLQRNVCLTIPYALLFARRILINGLGSFRYWRTFVLPLLSSRVVVYLHETEFVLTAFSTAHPHKMGLLRWVLRRRKVLCVSEQQRRYLNDVFGTEDAVIVYETIPPLEWIEVPETSKPRIVMVGSIQERKGVTLFSQVADLAKAEGLDWEFCWIGRGNAVGLYQSPLVTWAGVRTGPELVRILRKAAAFFLPSVDDPFPLSCLEALREFNRCVVYRKVGTAEILDGVQGCAVYEDYTPAAALKALHRALAQQVDREKVLEINRTVASVEAFSERLRRALQ
jgi:glycosyltransferase involved in cell wall biosynthesis